MSDEPTPGQESPQPISERDADRIDADRGRALDEALLGGERSLTLDDLAAQTNLSHEFLRSYWQALGLPILGHDERSFTVDDAQALRDIAEVAGTEELSNRSLTSLVRSVGHTTERLALWQAEALVEHMAQRHELDDTSARLLLLDRLPSLAPVLEAQMVHAWRRQIAALAGRWAVEFSGARATDERGEGELPLPRAVGFADIVSFTTRTASLLSSELSDFVSDFEAGARDVITAAGGRVVKTVGDAVLFIADDVETGAEVALGLATAGHDGHLVNVPPVRVSLVWGRVLSRFGDVFGPSVNLASRLTAEAEPGTVLLDQATAALLAENSKFALTGKPSREVRGLGALAPVRLQRAFTPEG
ncbi:adenylate/guanylate cyclase domain-containing protein [Sanguibacter gelidistatuariae]|uniref:adenylate/guanylate cyclase domain-containing protein n=1 Tax=Sanguibacter gelidistatuariae TaxID=1814289 RepID=UPI00316AD7FB